MVLKQAQTDYKALDRQLCAFLDSLINKRLIELSAKAKENPKPLEINVDGSGITLKIGLSGSDLAVTTRSLMKRGRCWGCDAGKWEEDYESALKGEYNPANNSLKEDYNTSDSS